MVDDWSAQAQKQRNKGTILVFKTLFFYSWLKNERITASGTRQTTILGHNNGLHGLLYNIYIYILLIPRGEYFSSFHPSVGNMLTHTPEQWAATVAAPGE